MKQICIAGIPVSHSFHQADGPFAVSGFLDHSALGKAGKLAEHSAVRNSLQIGQCNLGLSVVGKLLCQKKPRKMMVAVDKQRKAQSRRKRLSRIALFRQDKGHHGRSDMLLDCGNLACFLFERCADIVPVELSRQLRVDQAIDDLPLLLACVEGGEAKRNMRWKVVCLKSGYTLFRLVDEPEAFRHQRCVKSEKGWHAGVGINRDPAGFEKGGNAGITLTGRDKAPATDYAGHGKCLTVFGDSVGKHNAGRPVIIAQRQRCCRFTAQRHHDVQSFKLAAKGGCLLDIAIIILCQECLPQQCDIAGIILERAQEKICGLSNIVEIESLPRCQKVACGCHCVMCGTNGRGLVRTVRCAGRGATGLGHAARNRRGALLCQGDGGLLVAAAPGNREQHKDAADRKCGRPVTSSSMKRGEHDPSLPAY